MKHHLGLVFYGLAACSSSGEMAPADLGASADLAMPPSDDLSAGGDDLSTGGNADMRVIVPGSYSTVSVIAGLPGGPGDADGTGRGARFKHPQGIGADGVGNVYVADTDNYRIRKIVVSSGDVTTLAGTGASGTVDGVGTTAAFKEVYSLAADNLGNVYIGDPFNNAVRKLVAGTRAVTTPVGALGTVGTSDGVGNAARWANPWAVTLDDADTLYVSDNSAIRKVVLSSATVSTIAGMNNAPGTTDGVGTAARFNNPRGVAIDGAGNLFTADYTSYTIRKLELSTANVTTFAGMAGMIGTMDGVGSAATFPPLFGLAADRAGSLFVPGAGSRVVRKVVIGTANVSTLAGVANASGSIDGLGAAARFSTVMSAATDGLGNLYVADADNSTVRRIVTATGDTFTLAGSAENSGSQNGVGLAARFVTPAGLAQDGAGNVYVSDSGSHVLRKFDRAGVNVTLFAGATATSGTDNGVGTNAKFYAPTGIVADGNGNLYVADKNNSAIRKVVLSTATVSTFAGYNTVSGSTDGIGNAARFSNPTHLALDGNGNLYVADTGNRLIRKIVLATAEVSTVAGMAGVSGNVDGIGNAARFRMPLGLATDGNGNLYVSDQTLTAGSIRKLELATRTVTTLTSAVPAAGAMATDGLGSLFVTSYGFIHRINIATGNVSIFAGKANQHGVQAGALPSTMNNPSAITVMPDGELLVADPNEHCIIAIR